MNLNKMTKTPTEFVVEGKTYKLSPLELRHLAMMEQWADDQQFEKLRGKIAKLEETGLPETAFNIACAKLAEDADAATRSQEARATEMQSVAGILKGIRLSLEIAHPKLRDKEFNKIIKEVGMGTLENKMDKLNETGEEDVEAEAGNVEGQA